MPQVSQSFVFSAPTDPVRGATAPVELSTPVKAIDLSGAPVALLRGQYRIVFRVSYDLDAMPDVITPVSLKDTMLSIDAKDPETGDPLSSEFKRFYVYKIDRVPDPASNTATVTAVVRVMDNPLLVTAIVATVAAVLGGVVAYSSLDTVEGFAEKALGIVEFAAIGAAIAAAVTLLWRA